MAEQNTVIVHGETVKVKKTDSPHIVIEVNDGMVSRIHSTDPNVEILVVDNDSQDTVAGTHWHGDLGDKDTMEAMWSNLKCEAHKYEGSEEDIERLDLFMTCMRRGETLDF